MESSSLHLAMQPRHPPSLLLLCSEAKSSAKISANSRANPQSVSRSARPDDWPQQHSGVLARPCQTSGFASLRRSRPHAVPRGVCNFTGRGQQRPYTRSPAARPLRTIRPRALARTAKAIALFSPDQVQSEVADKEQAIKL